MAEPKVLSESGQKVRWRFGGPVMVVRSFTSPDSEFVPMATCVWFSPDDHFHSAKFPVDELEVVGGRVGA